MLVQVNGQQRDVPDGCTMAALVDMLKLEPKWIAVERNKRIVPRKSFGDTPVADGDVIEIVTLVGGG